MASLEKAIVVHMRLGEPAVLKGRRHSDECDSAHVDVCVQVHLRPTPESLTYEHDGPEIGNTSRGIDDHSGITSQIHDRPGGLSTPPSSVADEYAHLVGDKAASSDLDRGWRQTCDRGRRFARDGQEGEGSRRVGLGGLWGPYGGAVTPGEETRRRHGERWDRTGQGRQPVPVDVGDRARSGPDEDDSVLGDFGSNQGRVSSRSEAGLTLCPDSLDWYAASMNACTASPSSEVTSGVSPR